MEYILNGKTNFSEWKESVCSRITSNRECAGAKSNHKKKEQLPVKCQGEILQASQNRLD